MSHTEGTLTQGIIPCILSINDSAIGKTCTRHRSSEENEANARRLVACWNAMDGIDDPELWVAQMEFMDSDHTISVDAIRELQQERDELVKAVESAEIALTVFCDGDDWIGTMPGDALREVRAVLDQVKP